MSSTTTAVTDKSLQFGSDAWSACADRYTEEATYFTSPQSIYAIDETIKLLKSTAKGKLTVADIACGSGAVPINLVTRYPNDVESIVASDYSAKMCTLTEQRYDGTKKKLESEGAGPIASLKTVLADAQDLSAIASNSVDATFCIFGVMYLPEPKKASAEMIRITKPGGLICLMSWVDASHSQSISVFGLISKHLTAKAAEEAAKSGVAAPPVAQTASSQHLMPFDHCEHYQALFDEFNLKTELLTTHPSLTRQYSNATEFWHAMLGISPLGKFSPGGVTPQESIWAIEFVSSLFGPSSPFSLTTNAVLAIGRKQ